MEQELTKQMESAMMMGTQNVNQYDLNGGMNGQQYPAPPRSEVSFNLSEA